MMRLSGIIGSVILGCCVVAAGLAQPVSAPLTLRAAVVIALQNNSQIEQAREAVTAAESKVTESRYSLYPQMTIQASYARLGPVSTFSVPMGPAGPVITMKFGLENSYNAILSIQRQLFDWGRTGRSIEMGEAGVKMSQNAHQSAQLSVAHQVVQFYHGMLVSREAIKVFDQNISSMETRLASMRKRFEFGMSSRFDVLTMEVQLASLKGRRIEMENNLTKLGFLFNRLLGRSLDTSIELRDSLVFEPVSPDADSLEALAIRRRPEIAQFAAQEELLLRQLEFTRTFDKPMLALNLAWGVRNGFFPNPDVLRGNWNASVVASYPLFDGFRASAQSMQAEVSHRTARLRTEEMRQLALLDVRQALADLIMNRERVEIEALKSKQAEEALRIAEDRFAKGLMSTQDLLDAQSAWEGARLGHLQALYSYALSKFAVDKSTGALPVSP